MYINYIEREVDHMKNAYKIFMILWIMSLIVLIFLLGYYYGHYMNPHNIIRYVPYCKHVKATWI